MSIENVAKAREALEVVMSDVREVLGDSTVAKIAFIGYQKRMAILVEELGFLSEDLFREAPEEPVDEEPVNEFDQEQERINNRRVEIEAEKQAIRDQQQEIRNEQNQTQDQQERERLEQQIRDLDQAIRDKDQEIRDLDQAQRDLDQRRREAGQ